MRFKSPRFLVFTAAAVIVLNSCKKSTQPNISLSLTGTYTSATIFELGQVQMFTAAGQVTDVNLVKDFARRRQLDFSWEKTGPTNFGSGKFVFANDNEATTDVPNRYGVIAPASFTVTDRSSTGFVLKQNEAIKNGVQKSSLRSAQLVILSNQLQPISNCHTEISGQEDRCDYNYLIPFVIANNNLKLAYYTVAVHSEQGSSLQGYSTTTVGLFNKAVTQQLIADDTLVVQTKLLPLSKN
ncbi:hypothetical protein D0C36_11575 [Mucilaginibacter conchicola]|uniref:Uncharacterized protein n=1 Tax=Mucilaginibacter conchicola TaxID=2303333 RepID=A0A372NS29_9SPHI|nr:hypothetical protein [Mucilaginibacter conchicola]RFZ92080.1 hypothetical protein D0C36_11575 [Mucilaginibacter conchicola]